MSSEQLLGPDEMGRTIRRLAHEIIENNRGTDGLMLVGLLSRGYPLAQRLAAAILAFEGAAVPVGKLDIGLHRDDVGLSAKAPRLRPSRTWQPFASATLRLRDDSPRRPCERLDAG